MQPAEVRPKPNTLEHFVKSSENQGQILRKIKSRFTDIFSRGWGSIKIAHPNFRKNFREIFKYFSVPRGDKK